MNLQPPSVTLRQHPLLFKEGDSRINWTYVSDSMLYFSYYLILYSESSHEIGIASPSINRWANESNIKQLPLGNTTSKFRELEPMSSWGWSLQRRRLSMSILNYPGILFWLNKNIYWVLAPAFDVILAWDNACALQTYCPVH